VSERASEQVSKYSMMVVVGGSDGGCRREDGGGRSLGRNVMDVDVREKVTLVLYPAVPISALPSGPG